MHILREAARASGWHKGGRSYGVSTTLLPKSAPQLTRLTYLLISTTTLASELRLEHSPSPSSCPSVLSTLRLSRRTPLGGPSRCLGATLSCSKAAPPSCARRSFLRRREGKCSLQGCRNKMARRESVARVWARLGWNTRRGRPGTDEFDVPSGLTR